MKNKNTKTVKQTPIKIGLEVRLEKQIKCLEDRLTKLEMLHDAKSGIRHEETQPSDFKVGDYVEFYDDEKVKHKGTIIRFAWCDNEVVCDIRCDDLLLFQIPMNNIIGYAKTDLLTQEEKEYLSAVIKPFRNEVDYIVKECDGSINFGNYESGSYIGCCLVYCYHFRNLKEIKRYKLKELL